MNKCESCGANRNPKDKVCPYCGYSFNGEADAGFENFLMEVTSVVTVPGRAGAMVSGVTEEVIKRRTTLINKSNKVSYIVIKISVNLKSKKATEVSKPHELWLYGANLDNIKVGDELYIVK